MEHKAIQQFMFEYIEYYLAGTIHQTLGNPKFPNPQSLNHSAKKLQVQQKHTNVNNKESIALVSKITLQKYPYQYPYVSSRNQGLSDARSFFFLVATTGVRSELTRRRSTFRSTSGKGRRRCGTRCRRTGMWIGRCVCLGPGRCVCLTPL